MSPMFRRDRPPADTDAGSGAPGLVPMWLPGDVQVATVGETFYQDAIAAAAAGIAQGSLPVATLVPEPDNPHDKFAVGVHLNGRPAGHLPRDVAQRVQLTIRAFMDANGGRPPACPASITYHDVGPEVVLHLDPARLGLTAAAFDMTPDLDRAIAQFLPMIDRPVPALTGIDSGARTQLASAEQRYEAVDADYERGPGSWPRVEQMFLEAAARLERAHDPLVSAAWAGVARSRRYQKGRRNDHIEAALTALYWDRANTRAWAELAEAASAAPHVPTLLELFRRIPLESRPKILSQLIALSRGHDRLGNMRPAAGEQLRAALAQIAQADSDKASIAKLTRDARRHAPAAPPVS